ncbi:hypothetical protein [Parasitella parasitica]|uniref:Uncharacterized protein n=1 Tax=Parasitella parasitica TaxID=35722 RepID=A0A0B7NDX7_9FUNG|nr:hypothetical protein [Parasitella parasitica]
MVKQSLKNKVSAVDTSAMIGVSGAGSSGVCASVPSDGGKAREEHVARTNKAPHGPNDSHATKNCQFLKFQRAKEEGKCVKCWKPFEKGHLCHGNKPPGVGPSPTSSNNNHEVFATSVVPASKAESSTKDIKFEHDLDFDVLLGVDVLPKMNIGLTGVAFRIDGEHVHSDAAVNDEEMFKNINLDFEGKDLEADNAPAGTVEEQKAFVSYIKESLRQNALIPVESSCPLPESIIQLPTKEGATAHRRPFTIAESLKPVVEKQIKEWLRTETIGRSRINTKFF